MPTGHYLIGAPGVGKSTVIDLLIYGRRGDYNTHHTYGPFGYEVLDDLPRPSIYLGKHRDLWPGTDALRMSILPVAKRWVTECDPEVDVYGEGARLTHVDFLEPLHRRWGVHISLLVASQQRLDERCTARGSDQKRSFRKGAETRAYNTMVQLEARGVPVRIVETSSRRPDQVAAELRLPVH